MASSEHNKDRYGEVWPQARIDASLAEMEHLKPYVALSGGWAWHMLSPAGHVEYKHAHDHKDIDVFVRPTDVAVVVSTLKAQGFEKVRTKYDHLPSEEDFRRYEKHREVDGKAWRITIDFFVDSHPERIIDGWRVIEPEVLLGFYSNIHSSDKCFAVRASVRLLADGIDPQGHPDLVAIPGSP